MDRIRDISNATVITHGENSEVFTIDRGIFIPIDMGLDFEVPEMRAGLLEYLSEWYTPGGYIKYPICRSRLNRNRSSQKEKPEELNQEDRNDG